MREIDPRKKAAIIDALGPGEEKEVRTRPEIHRVLVEKKLVKNKNDRKQTGILLKKMEMEGIVTNVGHYRYKLNIIPEEFQLFDYLSSLREKKGKDFVRADVGGWTWKESNIYLMGMPNESFDDHLIRGVNQILGIRISRLFESQRAIAWYLNQKRAGKKVDPSLLRHIIREAYLEVVPFFLGSKAGLDGDGLTEDQLEVVTKKIIDAMPEEISEESWGEGESLGIPTLKQQIAETAQSIERILMQTTSKESNIMEEMRAEEELGAFNDFAMIITCPDYVADEQWEENSTILHHIKELKEGSTALEVAFHLANYDTKKVEAVLRSWGTTYLTPADCESLNKMIGLLHDASVIASHMLSGEDFFEDSDKSPKGEAKREVEKRKDLIRTLIRQHDTKEIIPLLAFTEGMTESTLFYNDIPKATKILLKYFEGEPQENIEQWLSEGRALRSALNEKILKNLKDSMAPMK